MLQYAKISFSKWALNDLAYCSLNASWNSEYFCFTSSWSPVFRPLLTMPHKGLPAYSARGSPLSPSKLKCNHQSSLSSKFFREIYRRMHNSNLCNWLHSFILYCMFEINILGDITGKFLKTIKCTVLIS